MKNIYIFSSLQIDITDMNYLLKQTENYTIRNNSLSLNFEDITENKDIIDLLEFCLGIDQKLLKTAIDNFIDGSGFLIDLDLLAINKEKNSDIESIKKWIDHIQCTCIIKNKVERKFNEFNLIIELLSYKIESKHTINNLINGRV